MYEYLSQHPLVVTSKVQEAHYFDRFFNKKIPENDVEAHRKWYLNNYFEGDVLKKYPSRCLG
jgi:hypothetical protein